MHEYVRERRKQQQQLVHKVIAQKCFIRFTFHWWFWKCRSWICLQKWVFESHRGGWSREPMLLSTVLKMSCWSFLFFVNWKDPGGWTVSSSRQPLPTWLNYANMYWIIVQIPLHTQNIWASAIAAGEDWRVRLDENNSSADTKKEEERRCSRCWSSISPSATHIPCPSVVGGRR